MITGLALYWRMPDLSFFFFVKTWIVFLSKDRNRSADLRRGQLFVPSKTSSWARSVSPIFDDVCSCVLSNRRGWWWCRSLCIPSGRACLKGPERDDEMSVRRGWTEASRKVPSNTHSCSSRASYTRVPGGGVCVYMCISPAHFSIWPRLF